MTNAYDELVDLGALLEDIDGGQELLDGFQEELGVTVSSIAESRLETLSPAAL